VVKRKEKKKEELNWKKLERVWDWMISGHWRSLV